MNKPHVKQSHSMQLIKGSWLQSAGIFLRNIKTLNLIIKRNTLSPRDLKSGDGLRQIKITP